jgi:hypothetical protein
MRTHRPWTLAATTARPCCRAAMLGAWALAALIAAGCGNRDEVWSAIIPTPTTHGLNAAVGLIDAPAARLLLLSVHGDNELAFASQPLDPGLATAAPTPDGERLLVLARGVVPRRTADDAPPTLSVFGGGLGTPAGLLGRYPLSDPLSGMSVDPESRYAVLYSSAADAASLVQNPNELIVVDLSVPAGPDNPFPLTVRSFGGTPQGFTFTPTLSLPGGERRLLVVQTDRDVCLVDLAHLDLPEITVKLTGGTEALVPGGVAVSDGDPDPSTDTDARIAIRLDNDPNVILIELLPVPEPEVPDTPQSFVAQPNVVYVGGTPSDIAFVQTDGGLRLAALVPSQQALTLVDPLTGSASEIDLGAPFERLSLVTDVVGETAEGSDVALLWSRSTPLVAFVALGSTVGTPYKSVDLLQLEEPIGKVVPVPSPNRHLRILEAVGGTRFVVLDLLERTASPINSSANGTSVSLGQDGSRVWLHAAGPWLGQLDLGSLHPSNLALSYPIHSVFEVARPEGGRALVAIHPVGGTAVSVLDALSPSLATAREYAGVLLGGLP